MLILLQHSLRALALGVRSIWRRPLASTMSVICLGIGLAACATVWTLIDATILRPFDVPHTDRLVVAWETDPVRGQPLIEVSYLNAADWARESRTLESMASFGSSHWPTLARIGSDTFPLAARAVSAGFFQTLEVRPLLGRDFTERDTVPASPLPVMLSHRLWQSRFGQDASIVGRSIFLDGTSHQIIGVMPKGFAYPDDPDLWLSVERALAESLRDVPLDTQRQVGVLEVLGRRRLHVSNDEVRAELSGIVGRLRRQYHPADQTVAAAVTPFSDLLLGRLGSRLGITFAMAFAVLLFACANVAAVRLAHARERAGELAARILLGASQWRLRADLSVEIVPIVVAASVVGSFFCFACLKLISSVPAVSETGVSLDDHWMAAVVGGGVVSTLAWLLVGPLPAWVVSRRAVIEAQQHSARLGRRATATIPAPVLVGQAAIAIAAVAIATTAWQTFERLSRTDVGFATDGVALVDFSVPDWKYPTAADGRRLLERLQQRLRSLPGVDRVAAVSLRPFRFGEIADGLPVRRTDHPLVAPDDATPASRVVVTTDYFDALGQPIVEGRAFTAFDRDTSPPVAIISRTLARALWGDMTPIGKEVETYTLSERWRARTVVGVSQDARYRGLERPSMELYVPESQSAVPLASLVLAGHGAAGLTDAVIRDATREVEPELAIEQVQTTARVVQSALSPARLLATAMSLLGSAGLLLLALGVFAVSAAAVRAAWSEIAVRQAVGATPFQAARAPLGVLGRSLVTGITLGLLVTPLVLSRGLLDATRTTDPRLPIVAAVIAVLFSALLAIGPVIVHAARRSPADLLREL